MNDPKHIGDAAAIGVAIGAWAQFLPPAAALASLLWIGWQWWHHPVTREWRAKWRKQP